jgi:hypothetical protein
VLAHPCLLFPDDLDDVAADEDGVRRRVDLRLLVAEPRDHPALRDGGGVQAGDVGQRLEATPPTSAACSPTSTESFEAFGDVHWVQRRGQAVHLRPLGPGA